MEQHDIHDFLIRYFRASGCEILENDAKSMKIQLTVEMDKRLMNRPFYWKYIEKLGQDGQPLELKLVTDPELAAESEGEFIHFGSPRLHQIFQSTKDMSVHTRLYENVETIEFPSVPLEPWIGINAKISYQCDRKKDEMVSFGLQLINGQLIEKFHEQLLSLDLTPKIPNFCFTISPLIKPGSGFKRIAAFIKDYTSRKDETWAHEAERRWAEDLDLLDQFYENTEEKPESYESEKEALRQQYEPRVRVEIINGGLFYLRKKAFTAT
ncbi:MAG TPA: YqhG family protein [Bacillales bacterium]|nr:YqhG family protein [Bacillales bacterium]